MGRGRAKAKQTKVARELKYHSPHTDYAALQRELAGDGKSSEEFDNFGEFLDEDSEDEDDDEEPDAGQWSSQRR
jgi:hypothetical protein